MKFKKLLPKVYYRSLADIDFNQIAAGGKKLVLLDVDNTLIKHGMQDKTPFAAIHISRIKKTGMDVALLSNAKESRVSIFAEKMDIKCFGDARKPSTRKLKHAMEFYGVTPSETVVIGDQILTDILCGNFGGAYTILVAPISKNERWYIRAKRAFEYFLKLTLNMKPRKRKKKYKNHFWKQSIKNSFHKIKVVPRKFKHSKKLKIKFHAKKFIHKGSEHIKA